MSTVSILLQPLETMDDHIKLLFEFAWKFSEQLIFLATLLIGLCGTFAKEFKNKINVRLFDAVWILLFVSILAGLYSFMAFTGYLDSATPPEHLPSDGRGAAIVQLITFAIGAFLFILSGRQIFKRS